MAQLSTKIKSYCEANGVSNVDFTKDVMLQDDSNGQGAYIKEWNLDIAQPTDEQLASHETAANTEENNTQVDATRRSQYGSWNDQLDEIYHSIDDWTLVYEHKEEFDGESLDTLIKCYIDIANADDFIHENEVVLIQHAIKIWGLDIVVEKPKSGDRLKIKE